MTEELDRIRALASHRVVPSQEWLDLAHAGLRQPGSDWSLFDHQAECLHTAWACGGLVGDLPVGSGKSLVSLLIPSVCELRRPLLLVPASLERRMPDELRMYRKHWRLPGCTVKTYETLSRDKDANGLSTMLSRLRPDGIICDEAHYLTNRKAGVTRKFLKHLQANPDIKVYILSGTLVRNDVTDFAHLCAHALRELSPLPHYRDHKGELKAWSQATSPSAGVEHSHLTAARWGLDKLGPDRSERWPRRVVGERIRSSPGYVSTDTNYDGPLRLEGVDLEPSDACLEAIADAEQGRYPDGTELPQQLNQDTGEMIYSPLAMWRLVQELCCGYWSTWDPRPPDEWLDARRAWHSHRQKMLDLNPQYDTPEAVKYAVEAGRIKGAQLLREWQRIKPTYTYDVVPHWIDKHCPVMEYAAEYLRKGTGRLVWTRHRQVAEVLSEQTGCGAYADGQGTGGRPMIERAGGKNSIVTIDANSRGRNLQYGWCDNLLLTIPANGGDHEQILGRTHRYGQTRPVVSRYVFVRESHRRALARAYADADAQDDLQTMIPKLIMAQGNLRQEVEYE